MNKSIHKQQAAGSITVFLSLILILVLSLILTIIEGARVSTAKVMAERALSTAMDSVLAEYYGPLWEEYHLFGLYTGEGNETDRREQIATKLTDYMSYTFDPDKGINSANKTVSDEYFPVKLNSVSISDETMLMDYQGKLLINQAVEYMKYREIGNGVELLLNKLSLLETPEKVSYVYEEKQKVEGELVEIDKGVLQLMELLDGLRTSKTGIEVTKQGTLKTADYFVKKICNKEVTKESVGINQNDVFLALKESYVNPESMFTTINASLTGLEQAQNQINAIQAEQASISETLSLKRAKLDELKAIKEKTKENKKEIETIKQTIKELEVDLPELSEEENEEIKMKMHYSEKINTEKNNLLQLISGIKPIISKAISVVDTIILKTETVTPLINKYEEFLYSEREGMNEEVFNGLEENLGEMKKYITTDDNGYDFAGMKVILENNQSILEKAEIFINQGDYDLVQGLIQTAKTSYESADLEMKRYQIDELTMDYSTLVINKSAQEAPLSKINSLLQMGISSLVIDPNLVSKDKLTLNTLPSQIAALSGEDTDFLSNLTSFFENAVIGKSNSDSGSLFKSFSSGTQILAMAGDGVNKIAEHVLYQEYLNGHFERYMAPKEESIAQKPSALTYEQEYLLVGKRTDQENLSSVISRIVFLRTIMDFASILGDSAKRNEAKAVAVALVGFTGLPILVGITQVLVLLAWSFAEALLDVCALMQGEEVPILKKKVVLEFPEIFMINRSYLQSKASAVSNSKELSFSYQDYLRVFLLMKSKKDLAFRSLDLMQENIRVRYDVDPFQITNCLFGYEVAADCSIASRLTGISYMKKYIKSGQEEYTFPLKYAYSY